jgi:3-hydroxybutyryl-CoA dehydrogenase
MTQPLAKARVVAVIGSGVMGAGIAQVAAASGHEVRLFDTRRDALDKAISGIGEAYAKLVEKGRMGAAEADRARERVQAVPSLRDVADAALVIEAVLENLDVKRKLFAELEDIVTDECILATNTSSISITAIAAVLKRPGRMVGMHFFNPVPRMALVEVISGLASDPRIVDAVCATAESWGKSPVRAKSTPGFIVNRVARPYYAEALRLLTEGAGDPATLDAVMRDCGGFRMGPFELMDLIGHDVNFAVTQSVFDACFGDPRFTPSIVQQELVSASFLGRKSGRGFYDYRAGATTPLPQAEARRPSPGTVCIADALIASIGRRLSLAGVDIASERQTCVGHDAPAFHCGDAVIYLTDGRSATQRAAENSMPDTVLFDLMLDPAGASRIALARADQCGDSAYDAAVGLFQAAGFVVTRLDDVPGMAVMRTVAMLANEAADAVNQGVCSAGAVDMAMQKGVNYPRGPLAWADELGVARVVKVLSNLAASYGEDRYRVSPLLRRKAASGGRLHDDMTQQRGDFK